MVFTYNHSKLVNHLIEKPKRTCYLVFVLCLIVSLFILNLRYQVNLKNHQREMSGILDGIHKSIDLTLKSSYTSTLTLAMTVNHHGEVENFERVAQQILESNQNLDVVQLVPNGIIKYIYPLKGNEMLMDYNILGKHSALDETHKAITIDNMYFAGPFELKQGGIGIVGRYPIYKDNTFWGFSAVVIKLDKLLQTSGIQSLDPSKYYFQFGKIHPVTKQEVFYVPHVEPFSDKHFESETFSASNWRLYLVCKSKNHLLSDLLPYILLSLLLSSIIALLTGLLLKKPSELLQLARNQQKSLLKSEARYQTIFNQAKIGILQIDYFTEMFIEANEQFLNLMGYTNAELQQMKFHEVTHPEDAPACIRQIQKLKSGEIQTIVIEKRYVAKNKTIVWVSLSASPFRVENEEPTAIIAIVEDITARKKAEQKIKKSEMQFKSLFNDSPIALWEHDFSDIKKYLNSNELMKKPRQMVDDYFTHNPQATIDCIRLLKVRKVNKECLILHEVDSQEALLQNFTPILEQGSLDALQKILVGITQYDKRGETETRVLTSKGKKKNIALVWNVVRGFEKSYERVIISTEDITDRKESEAAIITSQQRTESLINTIDGIVWECNAENSHYTFISKKVEYILGYTVKEWMNEPNFWSNHIHPDDKEWIINYTDAQTKAGKQHDVEYRMIAKDKRVVWVRDIVNVIEEPDGSKSLRGIMIDITKSKDAEMDLHNSFDLVSEQNKRMLNFSYIVSHNLRSHTSNIQSLSLLINTAETELERQPLLPLLASVSNALNETMHNLNEVINIQTNININISTLDLKECIQKTLELLSPMIDKNNIQIQSDVPAAVKIDYNPAYMESMLMNLISNAIRYYDPSKESYVKISTYMENGKNVLEIRDNGIGIDLKKNRDKLFGMYKTFSNNPDSRGMGLFITKNQIDAMGGSITVESELHQGTTFKVYFK